MNFLERLRSLMAQNGDSNNSVLAKKSGIPYTTIDGLFKRGWEKAQISTIQRICDYYGVSLDYMVYGADKLSEESQMFAAKYDTLDAPGRELIAAVMDTQIKRIDAYGRCRSVKRVPLLGTAYLDGRVETKYAARQEQKELSEAQEAEAPCPETADLESR